MHQSWVPPLEQANNLQEPRPQIHCYSVGLTNAGSHDRLDFASSRQDRQLHAGHDVFQTLYFLVDLYLVGRLGKEAVAAVGVAGNLSVHRAGHLADAGRGDDHAHVACGGPEEPQRALLVFNQSQVLSMLRRGLFLVDRDVFRMPYASALGADEQTTAWRRITCCGSSRPWPAVRAGRDGAALRGIGNFKPGMVVRTATVIINIVLAPFLMFGWGTGTADGRRRRRDRHVDRGHGRRRVARRPTSSARTRILQLRAARHEAAAEALGRTC